jgi:hypothetical protein
VDAGAIGLAAWGHVLGSDPDVNIFDQRIVVVAVTLGIELGNCGILLQLIRRCRQRQAGIVGVKDGLCAEEGGGRLLLVLLQWGEVSGAGCAVEESNRHWREGVDGSTGACGSESGTEMW